MDKTNLIFNSTIELVDVQEEGNGKGRPFISRFIEPGIAHYKELGDILITKETLNKFIHTMVGCPVIIEHEDVTNENADKLRVGVVSRVWFNEMDGYFYCEGILTDPEAIDLVKNQGYNVSCAYSFVSDNTKKTHNGKEIDMEFIDGEFLHLALVKDPRYEGANIVVNKNDDVERITVKGNHIPIKKGQSKDEAVKEFLEGKQSDTKDKPEREEEKSEFSDWSDGRLKGEMHSLEDEIDEIDDKLQRLDDKLQRSKRAVDRYQRSQAKGYEEDIKSLEAKRDKKNQQLDKLIKEQESRSKDKSGDDGEKEEQTLDDKIKEYENKIPKNYRRNKQTKALWLYKNSYITRSEWEKIRINNSIGDITMTVLNDLTDFIKKVVKNEKDEEMKEVKNEDKRKLIDEIGGILKGKVDEEVWRTVVGKLEKVAYEPSEDDKADNKAKNEDDKEDKEEAKNKCKNEEDEKEEKIEEKDDKVTENEDEEEKEDKEDKAENKKVKNSMKDIVMGGSSQAQTQKLYTSRKERLEEGNKY